MTSPIRCDFIGSISFQFLDKHNESVQECLDPTLPMRILFAISAREEYGASSLDYPGATPECWDGQWDCSLRMTLIISGLGNHSGISSHKPGTMEAVEIALL